jgi:hypothetical protein
MLRPLRLALVVTAVAFGSSRLPAEEISGKIKSVDPDKSTLTLMVGDAGRTFSVPADAKITGLFGKKIKKAVTQDVPGGLRGLKPDATVTLSTEMKDGKEVVKQVKVDGLSPKIKKKTKKK